MAGLKQIFIVLISILISQSQDCQSYIKGLIANRTDPEAFKQLEILYFNSGEKINDFGNYDVCTREPTSLTHKYIMMQILPKSTLPSNLIVGLCVPKFCEEKDLQPFEDFINAYLSTQGIQANFQYGYPKEETERYKVEGGVIFMIFLICLLFSFGIFGIIIQFTNIGNKKDFKSKQIDTNLSDEEQDTQEDRQLIASKEKWALFFVAFSFQRNIKRLFLSKAEGDQNLRAFNGMRVLSMFWVNLGHCYGTIIFFPLVNPQYVLDLQKQFLFALVGAGYFAVDNFFFLSAFLATYLFLIQLYPKKGKGNYIQIYFHRFYRLLPSVMLLVGFFYFLFEFLGDGPLWSFVVNQLKSKCKKHWWSNFLFIQNLYPNEEMDICLAWTWYIPNDMQFFYITPIIIYIYCRHTLSGWIVSISILVGNVIYCMTTTIVNDIGVIKITDPDYTNALYTKPWSRVGAYMIGVLVAFLYYEYKQEKQIRGFKIGDRFLKSFEKNQVQCWIFHVIGFCLTFFFVFIQHDAYKCNDCWSLTARALYNMFMRVGFTLGVALFYMPLLAGQGKIFQTLLGGNIWSPLAKLTYCQYLCHLLVFMWYNSIQRSAFYWNAENMVWQIVSVIVIAYLISIPFSFLCETPLLIIEKLILFPPKTEKKSEKKQLLIEGRELEGQENNNSKDSREIQPYKVNQSVSSENSHK